MTDSRICPECKKEVPEDARYYYCPYCFYFFDRENNNRHDAVGFQDRFMEQDNAGLGLRWISSTSLISHIIVGILGDAFFFIILAIIAINDALPVDFWGWVLKPILFGLPGGLIAGYLGYRLEKKYNLSLQNRFGFFLPTFILGTILSFIFSCAITLELSSR